NTATCSQTVTIIDTTPPSIACAPDKTVECCSGSVSLPDYTTLRSFSASGADGQYPQAGVIEASDGDLYGTTYSGGSAGAGTVFKLHKDGTAYTILRSFSASDGQRPYPGVIEASDGLLYGATTYGGSAGVGTLF